MKHLLFPLACLLAMPLHAQRAYVEMNAMLGWAIPSVVTTASADVKVVPQPAFMPGADLNYELIPGALAVSAGFRASLYGCGYSSRRYYTGPDFVATIGFPAKVTYMLPVNDWLLYRFWVGVQPYIGAQYPSYNMHTSIEAGTGFRLGNTTSVGLAWIRPLHYYQVDQSSLRFNFIMAEVKFRLPAPPPLPRLRDMPRPPSPF